MKKLLTLLGFLFVLSSCSLDYDERLNLIEERLTALEKLCSQFNNDIESLKTIVSALQNADFITGIEEISMNGTVTGYTIHFNSHKSITIYHGKDGKDGNDGKDGTSPQIGVMQHTDGQYYWTLNGQWLLDDNGNLIPVSGNDGKDGQDGKDGITPLLKIEDGYWYVSTDNGTTWTQLGKATGEDGQNGQDGKDGKDGDSFFSDVTVGENSVIFKLADGTFFEIPRMSELDITFDLENAGVDPGIETSIAYTITSSTGTADVEVLTSAGIKATVEPGSDYSSGHICLLAESAIDKYSKAVVLVGNGDKVIMRSLAIEGAQVYSSDSNDRMYIGAEGGELTLFYMSNMECSVTFGAEAEGWISETATKAVTERTSSVMVAENTTGAERTGTVIIGNPEGTHITYTVTQYGFRSDENISPLFDPAFAQELQARGYIADANNITLEEVRNITKIDVSGEGWNEEQQQDIYGNLTSLKGIEHFTALTYLNCNYNQITSIDVSNNTKLTTLSCRYNQLSSLDISNNTELTELWCNNNQITSLDVSNNIQLTDLSCYNNQITSLDVSNNTALTRLFCKSNQLTSLDVSNNIQLTELSCYNNQITSLDVSNNIQLTELSCYNNQITSLDVSNNSALTKLFCINNQLTSLDISKNVKLIYLNCWGNPGLNGIFTVSAWFDNSLIPSGFTTGSWNYNGSTVTIDYQILDKTDITAEFDPAFAQELQARGYIADANNITLEEVRNITKIDVSGEGWNVEQQKIIYGNLTSLKGIEHFTALTYLDCSYNQITSIDVSNNKELAELWCGYNKLPSLDISNNMELIHLSCSNNQITSLDVSNNTNLTYLTCWDNQITSLDVSNNTNLTLLHCEGNRLTSLDVSNNLELIRFSCSNNQITSLDVSNNTNLTDLLCRSNPLTSLDVSNNKELTSLECNYNQITSLDISNNTNLTWLNCSDTQLTSLDISNNTALTTLYCWGNPGLNGIFTVAAWFDNNSIPSADFPTGNWDYNGSTVTIDYQKVTE